MDRLLTALVRTIETRFFDRDYLSSQAWHDLRADVLALSASATPETVADAAGRLLTRIPYSHVGLISPGDVARIAEYAAGAVPPMLQLTGRRGSGWVYVKLPTFTLPAFSGEKLAELLAPLHQDDVLVLDMRLNSSGSLSAAGDALARLVGPDVLFARTDPRNGAPEQTITPFPEQDNADPVADVDAVEASPATWYTRRDAPEPLPNRVVVAIGSRCTSAGEVFVQTLKEQRRAVLVGEPTAGAVVAGQEHELPSGWAVMVPFADMTSGTGAVLEGVGVLPDRKWVAPVSDTDELPYGAVEGLARLAQ